MSIRAAVVMVLTFVLGIVPATLLVVWAILMGAVGVAVLFSVGQPGAALSGLLLVAVSVLAVYGYVALFYAAGDLVTRRIARWLIGGVVANLVGIGLLAVELPWSDGSDWLIFGGPLVVGSAHLVRYAARARSQVARGA